MLCTVIDFGVCSIDICLLYCLVSFVFFVCFVFFSRQVFMSNCFMTEFVDLRNDMYISMPVHMYICMYVCMR
jgi:hypothetical protein